jgi:hypothetical protein
MSPTTRLRRASVAFATTTAFAVFCSSVPAQSDPQPTGQEKSATKLVDHDYAFELKRPERGWELLDELEAATLNEDAVAIARQSSTTLVVIVEQVGDSLDIDAYRDLAIESFGLPMKSGPELSDAQLGGVDGRQYEATADVGILVEFTSRIAIREGYAFQLLLSRRAGALDARAVERVFDSFSFRDGPIRGRAATFVQQNASGADWILEGGVYRNVAIGPGFALEPRTDLARVLFGTDLRALSATADVGLVPPTKASTASSNTASPTTTTTRRAGSRSTPGAPTGSMQSSSNSKRSMHRGRSRPGRKTSTTRRSATASRSSSRTAPRGS